MDFIEIIESNRQKFLHFNSIKYMRFQNLLPNVTVKRVVNSIPFLLSVNRKKLPGYMEGNVPIGIDHYVVDEDTKKFIKGKFPGVSVDLYADNPCIIMLAVMGSIGTVAYNKKSDFDYWVCVNREQFTDKEFDDFRKKVEEIQHWASQEISVPVHLFINDIKGIKNNLFSEDEDEAFGTTIGAVMKDEFLRSSIIIAGKVPLWWVIPGFVRDDEYEEMIRKIPKDLYERNFIDIGNLYEISKEDFLGAALFQIIKSLGNPFKSILKLGVLEKYLFGSDAAPILSHKVKMSILREDLSNNIIDAYLLMFREVYDYYKTVIGDRNMLNVLEQSLYLKIDPQLSRYTGVKERKNIPYKVEVMFQYVQEWAWAEMAIKEFDNFDNWDFTQVIKFWDSVKRFMLLSYQRIATQLSSLDLKRKISETDFTLLNRKLKTYFRKEKNKIEQLITFKDTTYESILYIEPISQGIREVEWMLYKRTMSEKNTAVRTVIRVENDLLRLFVWTAINNIYDQQVTRLNIQSGYSRINQHNVIEVMNAIAKYFGTDQIRIKNVYYLRPSFKLLNFIIINFNLEGTEGIETIHHLYHTSWGESFLVEHSPSNVSQVLYEVVKDGLHLRKRFEDYCEIIAPDMHKKELKGLYTLFKDAYSFLVESDRNTDARFVAALDEKIVHIAREGNKVSIIEYPSLMKLLVANNFKPRKQIRYRFFGEDVHISIVDQIYRFAQDKAITVVYEERDDIIVTYVINETGNLFVFLKSKKDREQFLISLFDFCKNIIKRVNEKRDYPVIKPDELKVYLLVRDRFGKLTIENRTSAIEQEYVLKYRPEESLVAYISKYMAEETFYNILFPDNVSSGFMSIKEIYSVTDRVRELRKNGLTVYHSVRDIVFSDLRKEDLVVGSTLYFLEKYKLEFMIQKVQAQR
jgi:adenylate cyclase class 1